MIAGLVCIFGITLFLGELAITETREVQVSIMGYTGRLFAVFIASLFVITTLIREFNDKTIEFIMALPVPRHTYFFGKFFGFMFLSVFVAIIVSFPIIFYTDLSQALIWCTSLVCELLIIITLCLLCLFTLGHVTTAFFTVMAFYILARSIGTIQLISQSPILETTSLSQQFMNHLLDIVAFVIPDFAMFTQTEWLVYHTGNINGLIMVALQTLIYIFLLSSAALFDLYRKEF